MLLIIGANERASRASESESSMVINGSVLSGCAKKVSACTLVHYIPIAVVACLKTNGQEQTTDDPLKQRMLAIRSLMFEQLLQIAEVIREQSDVQKPLCQSLPIIVFVVIESVDSVKRFIALMSSALGATMSDALVHS